MFSDFRFVDCYINQYNHYSDMHKTLLLLILRHSLCHINILTNVVLQQSGAICIT